MAQKGQQRHFHGSSHDAEARDLEKAQKGTRKKFQAIDILLTARNVSQETKILKGDECREEIRKTLSKGAWQEIWLLY